MLIRLFKGGNAAVFCFNDNVCWICSLFLYVLFLVVRIQASFHPIGTEGFLEHKKNLNMHSTQQLLFMLEICPFILRKSKFMSCSLELEKLKR